MVYLVAGTLPTYTNILDIERVTYAYDVCMVMQRPCLSTILESDDISGNNNNNIHIPWWWGGEFTIRVPQIRVVRAD